MQTLDRLSLKFEGIAKAIFYQYRNLEVYYFDSIKLLHFEREMKTKFPDIHFLAPNFDSDYIFAEDIIHDIRWMWGKWEFCSMKHNCVIVRGL